MLKIAVISQMFLAQVARIIEIVQNKLEGTEAYIIQYIIHGRHIEILQNIAIGNIIVVK